MPEIDLSQIPNSKNKEPIPQGVDLSGIPDAAPPKYPVIANIEGMSLLRPNKDRLNLKYKNSYTYAEFLGIPLADAWDMHDTISEQLSEQKMPESKIPEVYLPFPRIIGPNDDIGQIANDLGLPIAQPRMLGKTLEIPFIPLHLILNSPGAVSEVELASIPEDLEVRGSSILDFAELGGKNLAKVFPGGYTAEDAGGALDLDPELAGKIVRIATDLGVGYIYAGAVLKVMGGLADELMLQWRLLKIPERRLMLQTVEEMQKAGMSEGQIFKSLRNQGRTAEFQTFKDVALARRSVKGQTTAAEFEAERAAILEREGIKVERPVVTKATTAKTVEPVEKPLPTEKAPVIPEITPEARPKPSEISGKVRAEEIKTVKQLAEQAKIRATEKVSKEIEKEISVEDPYIKELKAVDSLVKRGDVRIAERLKEQDIEYEFHERVLEEESKILAKLIKKETVSPKLKSVIRKQTGQVKVANIIEVDEAKALKDQIRLEAAAAKKAYSAGKIEAAFEHKERQRELTARLRERDRQRDYIKKVKKDFRKLTKRIEKPKRKLGAGIPEPQRTELLNLIQSIDLVKPTEKTLKGLQGTREYLDNNPEAAIPDYVLKRLERLEKIPLRDMTFDDIESVHNAVMHHAKLAQLKNKIKVGRVKREAAEVVSESLKDMGTKEEITDKLSEIVEGVDVQKRSLGKWFRDNFGKRQEGYDLIIQSIAGPESVIYDVLYQKVKTGTRKALEVKFEFKDSFINDLKRMGFKATDLNEWGLETVTTGRFTLSHAQRVAIYMHSLNSDNRAAMINGGFGFKFSKDPNKVYKITAEEMDAIVSSLDKNELIVGEATRNLMQLTGDRLEEVFNRIYGYPMPRVDNYFHKDVMPLERGSELDSATEEFVKKHGEKWTKPSLPKGFLEARVGSEAPIYLNPVFDEINNTIRWASAFIGLEEPLNNASKLLYNKQFRKGLFSKYGDKLVWKEIDKGLKDIAGIHAAPSSLEQLFLLAKDRVVTTTFGLNPFIIMIQAASYPMYLRYVPSINLLTGAWQFWQEPLKNIKWLQDVSPEFRERVERGFNKDLAELSQRTPNIDLGAKRPLRDKLVGGIRGADAITVGAGMTGAIDHVLEMFRAGKVTDEMRIALDVVPEDIPNLSPEARLQLAVRYAEFATNLTQPNFQPIHRSPISRGTNVIEQVVSVFGSFTNRVHNMIYRDIRAYKRATTREAKNKAFNRVIQTLFLAFVVQTAAMVGRDELRDKLYGRETKDKNIPLRILRAWSSWWYGIRNIIDSAVDKVEKGPFGRDVDFITDRPFQITADMAKEALIFLSDEEKKKRDAAALRFAEKSIEALLLTQGLPYQNIKNIGKIVEVAAKPEKKQLRVTP